MTTSTCNLFSSRQPSDPTSSIFLDSLPKSIPAEVVELPTGRQVNRRLAELGIFAGAVLRVERSAPLGGPILVNVEGTLVALGRGVACRILVRTLP